MAASNMDASGPEKVDTAVQEPPQDKTTTTDEESKPPATPITAVKETPQDKGTTTNEESKPAAAPTLATKDRSGEKDANDVQLVPSTHKTSVLTVKSFMERKFTLTAEHAALEVVVSSQTLAEELDVTTLPISTLLEDESDQKAAANLNGCRALVLLQINSRALLRVMNACSAPEEHFTFKNEANTHVAPFKMLCRIYKDLYKYLTNLHARYGAELEGFVSNTEQSDVDPGKSAYLDLKELLSIVHRYIKPLWTHLRTASITTVPFNDLSALYQAGDFVVTPDAAQRVYRVAGVFGGYAQLSHLLKTDSGNELSSIDGGDAQNYGTVNQLADWHELVLVCYFIKHNGSAFVRRYKTFTIKPYRRQRDIKLIRPYPERFTTAKFREQRWEEGLQFYHMTDPANRPAFYKYKGRTLTEDFEGVSLTKSETMDVWRDPPVPAIDAMDVDVVVDIDVAILNRPRWAGDSSVVADIPLVEDATETMPSPNVAMQSRDWYDYNQYRLYSDDDPWLVEEEDEDTKDKEHRLRFKAKDSDAETSKQGLTNSILLLPGRVFGYLLRDREWTCFDLSSSASWKAVQADDTAWQQIQIRKSHRNNLVALVARHFKNKEGQSAGSIASHADSFDLIQGKGKGLVILLHGAPGVGKTSTAESIAAKFGKPLLPITCGNLGTDVYRVEFELKEHFNIAQKWGCIVLLDEADVFLARREKSDLNRNALVSIFLNTLEYFSGVLFLTTNRTGDFDEAFTSRIHLSLWYPDLDLNTTRKIWQNSMNRLIQQQVQVEDPDQILRYAEKHCKAYQILQRSPWNGRQIRNAFQTAVALAEFEAKEHSWPKAVLKWEHFQKVAITTNHFEGYLMETRGKSEDDLAKEFSLRARFNAYADIHTQDTPRMHEMTKWKKISLYKAHEFIESISPDKDVEAPTDLYEAEPESNINKALRAHRQPSPAQQPAYIGGQQYGYLPGNPMFAQGQPLAYQGGMPQVRAHTPNGTMQQGYMVPPMQQGGQQMQYQQQYQQPMQSGQPQYQQQVPYNQQPTQPQYQGSGPSYTPQSNGMMYQQSEGNQTFQDPNSQVKSQAQA